MGRISRRSFVASVCAALGDSLHGASAYSPLKPHKIELAHLDEPTVLSLLWTAHDFAEVPHHEAFRLPLRYRVAVAIKRTHRELDFGRYVHDSTSWWEGWDPQMHWSKKEIARRRQAIEAAAKKKYLANQIAEARNLLHERNCEFKINQCDFTNANPETLFIIWDIEAGHLSQAAQRVVEGEVTPTTFLPYHINIVGKAFIDARKYKEGIQFLSEVRDKGPPSLNVATLYWFLEAYDDARHFLRRVVKYELESAEKDGRRLPPAHLAGIQVQMHDREGALSTFKTLRTLDKPRFDKIQPILAGRMALANQDAEASGLLKGDIRDHSALANIVVGQARRGDYEAAFKTIEHLNSLTPLPQHEMPQHNLLAIMQRNSSLREALVTIMRIAARAGDLSLFRRANRAAAAIEPKPTPQPQYASTSGVPRLSGPFVFEDLTRTGHAKFAFEGALSIVNLPEKIAAICAIAEALVLPAQFHDPFVFFESW